jgi:hypothetical protein
MNPYFTIRPFYPEELRLLRLLKAKKEKECKASPRYHYLLVSTGIGILFTYLAIMVSDSFWVIPFGTIAVIAMGIIVFAPYEIYKNRKKENETLEELSTCLENGTLRAWHINANRIALAEEYEDEGDLFIIEYEPGRILFLWEQDHNLQNRFPCLNFDIYEESYCKLLGKQVFPLSERIDPVRIDRKAKWNYLCEFGEPAHLETRVASFEDLVNEFNSCAIGVRK